MPSPDLTGNLAALLRGEMVVWSTLHVTPGEFVGACNAENLAGLIHARTGWMEGTTWPSSVRNELAERARAGAAEELLRHREIASVLDALSAGRINPILFKGTPLAYEVYDAPHLRPRSDTDLFIPRSQVDLTRRLLAPLGYTPTNYCDGELLFCQFELAKQDQFGVDHAFDCHWKVSTQTLFADVLTYDELDAQAVPVPALGTHGRAAGPVHALLLACLHPVMHHRALERLIWIYDTHLLASRLSAAELDRFVALAKVKRVSTICAQALAISTARFGTNIPDNVTRTLAEGPADEPTAVYLQKGRRWHDELSSNLRGLQHWRDRVRLLREILFPTPTYMWRAYGLRPQPFGVFLLPALYLLRALLGGAHILAGRK